MIALQWQGQVLSLLDQSKYPQEESWITCTDVKAVAEVLSSGAVIEEKIAAVAGVYGYCLAALEHQALQQTPAFDEKLAEAKAPRKSTVKTANCFQNSSNPRTFPESLSVGVLMTNSRTT